MVRLGRRSEAALYQLRVRLADRSVQRSLEGKQGLPLRDYATHGGSFPIRVRGVGVHSGPTLQNFPLGLGPVVR